MPKANTNANTKKKKKYGNYYSFGQTVSDPVGYVSKRGELVQAIWVQLFGGMKVSALIGNTDFTKGMYVGVQITPKDDGNTMYRCFMLNEKSKTLICDAAAYLDGDSYTPLEDDEDLLPF